MVSLLPPAVLKVGIENPDFNPGGLNIQFHHLEENHWVMTSYDPKNFPKTVDIYDSLNSNISREIICQLENLYFSNETTPTAVILNLKASQKQNNKTDCGLFVISNATALCFNYNIVDIEFKISIMRTHLQECLQTTRLVMFPFQKCGSTENFCWN